MGEAIEGAVSSSYTATAGGDYYVVATTSEGCELTSDEYHD